MTTDEAGQLLTTSATARILDMTPDGVRALERRGKLRAMRTTTGQRLFARADVESVRDARTRGRRG